MTCLDDGLLSAARGAAAPVIDDTFTVGALTNLAGHVSDDGTPWIIESGAALVYPAGYALQSGGAVCYAHKCLDTKDQTIMIKEAPLIAGQVQCAIRCDEVTANSLFIFTAGAGQNNLYVYEFTGGVANQLVVALPTGRPHPLTLEATVIGDNLKVKLNGVQYLDITVLDRNLICAGMGVTTGGVDEIHASGV